MKINTIILISISILLIIFTASIFYLTTPKYLFNDNTGFSYNDLYQSVKNRDKYKEHPVSFGYISIGTKDKKQKIIKVRPDSNAQKAGLKTGDIILEINDKKLKDSITNFKIHIKSQYLNSPEEIKLSIKRKNKIKNILIKNENINHSKETISLYPDSLNFKNNYALGWFKVYKDAHFQLIHPINPDKLKFEYTKELYICDCKNGAAKLAYLGIYSDKDKEIHSENYFKNKKFKLDNKIKFENKNLRLTYFYYAACMNYQNKTSNKMKDFTK